MKALQLALNKRPVVYITRDIERALGVGLGLKNYFILTNYTPFGNTVAAKDKRIVLVKDKVLLNTQELLEHGALRRLLKKIPGAALVVFKNNSTIERLCHKQDYTLLNPSAQLANKIEEKVSQVEWLGKLSALLPPHRVLPTKKIHFENQPFILQFNHAHSGNGTLLIDSPNALAEVQKKFPERPVRVMDYIVGPVFTNNNIVWGKQILAGSINYQITGLRPFTQRPFATIGNDWELPQRLLTKKQRGKYQQIVEKVGEKLIRADWKGLFGVDVVLEAKTGKLYLLEINARQPASTTFESELQQRSTVYGLQTTAKRATSYITTFEAHLAALLDLPYAGERLIPITDGAQILQKRITNKELRIKKAIKKLRTQKYNVIEYTNTELESDLLRIQSSQGIMRQHSEFNNHGKAIVQTITKP